MLRAFHRQRPRGVETTRVCSEYFAAISAFLLGGEYRLGRGTEDFYTGGPHTPWTLMSSAGGVGRTRLQSTRKHILPALRSRCHRRSLMERRRSSLSRPDSAIGSGARHLAPMPARIRAPRGRVKPEVGASSSSDFGRVSPDRALSFFFPSGFNRVKATQSLSLTACHRGGTKTRSALVAIWSAVVVGSRRATFARRTPAACQQATVAGQWGASRQSRWRGAPWMLAVVTRQCYAGYSRIQKDCPAVIRDGPRA